MRNDETVQLARLFNRTADLLKSLQGRPKSLRSRDVATRYNTLREDVKQFVDDPNFDRTIPSAWCVRFYHIALVILVLLSGAVAIYLLRGYDAVVAVALVLTSLVVVVGAILIPWAIENSWFTASTVQQVYDRANMLYAYLQDCVDLNPVWAERLRPKGERNLARQLENSQSYVFELEEELRALQHELDRLRERLAGLETPSQFDVSQQVLDKLDRLEQTRLLEAIQAYRVNAWTPTAAVCGMILEGRLQRLCQEHGIRTGGIGSMIRDLGEAGLLRSYYQNLAQVGEFFRHRASHPTSEEFDREKTTLVLTSLTILIRDLF